MYCSLYSPTTLVATLFVIVDTTLPCVGHGHFGCVFFFQAEDGIRDLVRSRGLGDVYKRQAGGWTGSADRAGAEEPGCHLGGSRQPPGKRDQDLSLIHI